MPHKVGAEMYKCVHRHMYLAASTIAIATSPNNSSRLRCDVGAASAKLGQALLSKSGAMATALPPL